MNTKYQNQLQEARRLHKSGNTKKAITLLQRIHRVAPLDMVVAAEYATVLRAAEEFDRAANVLVKILKQRPKDSRVYSMLGECYLRMGHLEKMQIVQDAALKKCDRDSRIILLQNSLATALGNRKEALKYALELVQLNPASSDAFNNVGTALCDMAMYEQGAHAFETALKLKPNSLEAIQNISFCYAQSHNHEKALEFSEQALALVRKEKKYKESVVKFPMSFAYFFLGDWQKGWEYYDEGFAPELRGSSRRSPARSHNCPRWEGHSLEGKRLLVWREQGLGDELRFGSCLPDLMELNGHIIIECDARLVPSLRDSFPMATVRPAAWNVQNGNPVNTDYDFHIPIASLPRYLRPNKESFSKKSAYIKPQEKLKADIANHFNHVMPRGLKIGISWRSGKMDPVRNEHYNNLVDWADILQLPNCHFVNLQYGDPESELQAAENALGIKIHRWPDLNLKDDLEGTFALMSCLDLVVSVGSAVHCMAPLVDTETWVLLPHKHWIEMGLDEFPWAPKTTVLHGDGVTGIDATMPVVKDRIQQRLAQL